MRLLRFFVASTALLGCLIAPLIASAGSLEVKPIRVELNKGVHSATITVINQGSEPLRVQVTGFAWDQSEEGLIKLSSSDDLIVFPGLLVIPPLTSKSVRVAIETPPGSVEKTFRIYFEELPSLQSQLHPAVGAQVSLREKIGVPIFLMPENPASKLVIKNARMSHDRITFAMLNTGNSHLNVTNLDVVGMDSSGRAVYTGPLNSWYMLAGGQRLYDVKIPSAACRKVSSVVISGKVDGGADFKEPVSGGSCSH